MIPFSEKWTANSDFRGYAISVFTYESKMETGTEFGMFSDDLYIYQDIQQLNSIMQS